MNNMYDSWIGSMHKEETCSIYMNELTSTTKMAD